MTNGDYVNGLIFDKKLGKIIRENGFLHKLTKTFIVINRR